MQVVNTKGSNTLEKSAFKAVFLVLAWLIIFSLAKDAAHLRKGFERVRETKNRLEEQEKRNRELKIKLETVRTDEYRERLIRDHLNMQKEGEVVAVLPKKLTDGFVPKTDVGEQLDNWKKWLVLIR